MLQTAIFWIFGNICFTIICFPVYGIINYETNLSFLIKLFFYMTKKSGEEFKYLKNEKNF